MKTMHSKTAHYSGCQCRKIMLHQHIKWHWQSRSSVAQAKCQFYPLTISSGKHTHYLPAMHVNKILTDSKNSMWTLPNAYRADTQDFPASLGLGPVARLVPEGRTKTTKMRGKRWRRLRRIWETVRSSGLEWLIACSAKGWGPEHWRCCPVACTPCRSPSRTPPSPWTAAGINHHHMVERVPIAMDPGKPSGTSCA